MTPEVGAHAVISHLVGSDDTSRVLGSGDLDVLATPRLLAWFEEATVQAVETQLDDGQTSVGTRVELTHERPSPVGSGVTVSAELAYLDGRLLRFEVTAQDDAGVVLGHAQVTRVVVDRARFLSRL